MLPTVPGGIPWQGRLRLELANYAPLTVGGAFILFGGWWVLSAKNWFKGPVRMGTDEELEQLEASRRTEFALPADTQYETLELGPHEHVARGAARRPSHVRRYPIQAPPFWSIAWPVTPRASGESSQATVPAMSSGCDIRPSGTSRIASR